MQIPNSQKRIIYWFRNDLRIHDQPLLSQIGKDKELLPVFIFDSDNYGETPWGFPRTDVFRLQFLIETIANLKSNLQKLGSDLLVIIGKAEDHLPQLAETFQADVVIAQKEHTFNEISQEKVLEEKLSIPINFHEGMTMIHPQNLPFSIQELPEVYSDFRLTVEKICEVRPCFESPLELPSFPNAITLNEVPSLADLGLSKKLLDERVDFKFEGGEDKALERLHYYIWDKKFIKTYKQTKNGLLGKNYSTKLSAWLSVGALSPRKLYWESKRYEMQEEQIFSKNWLVFELLWRDYFRFVAMKHGDKIFSIQGIKGKTTLVSDDLVAFRKWRNGNIGTPLVDASMRELKLTGYMSNKSRQVAASFFCKELNLDWRWGAAWFESMLIDYDPCSNYGNWMYVAGVGNDAQEDRYFNVTKQAKKYDPRNEYVKKWLK